MPPSSETIRAVVNVYMERFKSSTSWPDEGFGACFDMEFPLLARDMHVMCATDR
jgi:hypothetical protein